MKTFRRRVADCGNAAELTSLLADAAREIGFDYIAIVSAVGLQQHAPFIVRNDNYPEDWAEPLIGGIGGCPLARAPRSIFDRAP